MKLIKPSCNTCKALIKAIDAYIAKADNELERKMSNAGYVDAKDSVSKASELEEELADILNEQTQEIAGVIEESDSIEDAKEAVGEYFKTDATGIVLTQTFEDYFYETISSLSDSYMKETEGDLSVTQLRKRTHAWIEEWSEQLSNLMQLTSEQKMGELLEEAINSGKGPAVFAQKLISEGIRQEGYRARATAITEMLRAHSVAQQEAIMQSPATDRKKWLHSGGHKIKPRENHVAMDGQIVPKEEPFELIGRDGSTYYPMYPRDPILPAAEAINCHCIHIPVSNDDILGLSYEERQQMQQEIIAADDREWEKESDALNRVNALSSNSFENEKDNSQGNGILDVDFKEIKSKEYGAKFKNFNESKIVQRKMRASATRILTHRSGTELEDLVFIDSNTGMVKVQRKATTPMEVMPTEAMIKMCEEADDYTVISMHNHSHSSVPSLMDITTCRDKKYKYGLAVCHDGTIYKYSVSNDINIAQVDGGLDYLERTKYIKDSEEKEKKRKRAIEILHEAGVEMEVF
ncbi:MAG: hypothetical protein IJ141_10705 [Lachnospiraceae bacterium]|nr:hypothetical protein [Lachnospiraceae bacterium]